MRTGSRAPVETAPSRWPAGFADAPGDRRALLVLQGLFGLTPKRLLELVLSEGSPAAALAAVREGRAGSDGDREHAALADPDALETAIDAVGARFVPAGSEGYPPQLNDLEDPPAALFVRGHPPPARFGTVAVVGARACSNLGRDVAHEIGRGVAAFGCCVVSGAARGIDSAAHLGALSAGGRTVAVLGCGIDVVYPRASRALLERIADEGSMLSEYPPGVPAHPRRFPARNRIVAGLSRALVVVEGAERSGSLISARHALANGRDVFAVPGSIVNPLASVPNELIRDGATLIRGVDDLLGDLELGDGSARQVAPLDLTVAERAAFDEITDAVLPERVATALGVSVPDVVALLMRLELKGLVRCVGGRYERQLRTSP